MHRREGPKFPWGKALVWLIPIALIIVVTTGCSNADDEGKGSNHATSRVVVTSAPATTDCNIDFVGIDSTVEDAIFRASEINLAVVDESTSLEDYSRRNSDASLEIAEVWRNAAANTGEAPRNLLVTVAEQWELYANIAIDDEIAQAATLRVIGDAFIELADEFDKCEVANDLARALRQEGLAARQTANEYN